MSLEKKMDDLADQRYGGYDEILDAKLVEGEAMPSALVKAQPVALVSWEGAADRAINSRQERERIVKEVLKKEVDYGAIPGCGDKPALFKAGAEKITDAMQLWSDFVREPGVIEDWDSGLFFYPYKCILRARGSDVPVAAGIGSCNSRENKYRWMWLSEDECKARGVNTTGLMVRDSTISELTFAVDEAKTSGQYSKPAEHWNRFKEAIASGTARKIRKKTGKGKEFDAWEIPGKVYRAPNEDVFSQVNTIMKMAEKRALVAAVLFLGFSQDFTQDIEDDPTAFGGQPPPPPAEPERQQAPPLGDELFPPQDAPPPAEMKPATQRAEIKEPQRKSAKGTKAELVDDADIKWLTDLALQHKIKNRRVMAFIGEKFRHGDGTAKKARDLTKKEFATVCAYVEEGSVSEALKKRVADNAVKYGVSMEFVREHCYKTWECQPKHLSPAELVALTEWIVGFEEPA